LGSTGGTPAAVPTEVLLPQVLIALLALPAGGDLRATRFAAVSAVERITLPTNPVPQVVVEPLDATVELRTNAKGLKALLQRITALVGQICPEVTSSGTSVILRCRSRRIDADLVPSANGPALEVRELRGLPYRGPADFLRVVYDLGPEEACPGTSSAAKGECALQAGRRGEAASFFRKALDTPMTSLASLRLGDIALETGDPETAIAWYRRITSHDRWAKLAGARLCELQAECLDGRKLPGYFETHSGDEELAAELSLRYARVLAYAGKPGESAGHLAALLAKPESGACDTMGRFFCRRLLLFAMEQSEEGADVDLVETYLTVPERGDGPLSVAMVRAAAELAARRGAPQFGGNMLAASASWVDGEPDLLREHLLRAAEMFLMAGDRPRARVIYDYAESRFPRKRLGDGRWLAVARDSRIPEEQGDESALSAYETLAAESARDLANAYDALVRSRLGRRK
jgi:tetratricopeptide (TPR) repeat protein